MKAHNAAVKKTPTAADTLDAGVAAPAAGGEKPPRARAFSSARAKAANRLLSDGAFNVISILGFSFLKPLAKLARGEAPRDQLKELWRLVGLPLIAMAIFLSLWSQMSRNIETSLGQIPGPADVVEQADALWLDHKAARQSAVEFYERQEKRIAEKLSTNPDAEITRMVYTGKPTYIDQIGTSLKTVFMGFLVATLVAVPLGILCGLSPSVNAALNPLIQIFKPVSPLAWLPIVTMVVSAVYVSADPMFPKSFITSAITVSLCSLWPTLINTALGVSSIDKDLMNVSKVLQLRWATKVFKLVLPSSLPLIFTGMRLSLGVGWMVLIAAEMLAQNPGLGKFVWDEFQNGSSNSLGRIMVAVFTIGIIGFLLDRVMLALQGLVTFGATR